MRTGAWKVLMLGLLCFPTLGYAAFETQSELSSVWHLTPPAGDVSVVFLGQLFGSVGGVLGSVSGQVMGQVFKALNYGMIVLAGAMLAYTTVMAVVNTSGDGQFMGQDKKSAWIILRTVLGISMMVPKASGYSFVQVFVMWAVVQGVGLADMAWGKVLDYLGDGGAVFSETNPSNTSQQESIASAVSASTATFKYGVCLAAVAKVVKENEMRVAAQSQATGTPQLTNIYQNPYAWGGYIEPITGSDGKVTGAYLRFGAQDGTKYPDYKHICGRLSLTEYAKTATSAMSGSVDYSTYISAASQQMVADQLAATNLLVAFGPSYAELPSDEQDVLKNMTTTSVVNGAMNYQNLTQPLVQMSHASLASDAVSALKDAKKYGWIMAGSYYYTLGRIHQSAVGMTESFYPSAFGSGALKPLSDQTAAERLLTKSGVNKVQAYMAIPASFFDSSTAQQVAESAVDPGGVGSSQAIAAAEKLGNSNPISGPSGAQWAGAFIGMEAAMIASGPIGAIALPIVLGKVEHMVNKWKETFSSVGDPLLNVSAFGARMVRTGVQIWIGTSIAIFLTSVAMSVMTSMTGVGAGLITSGQVLIPIIVSVVSALIANGVVLSVYVPLLPFLIFFFSALGWMMSVVEAMVAAPLVALGVTHPEGHDLLGKSEQSLMLLLSIFVKPIVMIIAFFAAMILTRIGVRMLNTGMHYFIADSGLSMSGMFQMIGLIMFYTLTIIGIVRFAFSLVHILPDKIMRWIGVAPESFNIEAQLNAIKSGVSSGAKQLADSAAGAGINTSGMAEQGAKDAKRKQSDAKKASSGVGGS